MKTRILTIFLILIVVSCRQQSSIIHENLVIDFPMNVENATKKFDLTYGCYSGFYKSNKNSLVTSIQLKNRPLFMGDDNINEDYYKNEKVAGITFFYHKESIIIDSIRRQLESRYNTKFVQIYNLEQLEYIENTDSMTYLKAELENHITIIIKEIDRKFDNDEYQSLTYYYDLSGKELVKYVTWIK